MKRGRVRPLSKVALYSIGPQWGIESAQELKARMIGDALGSVIANSMVAGRSVGRVIRFR